MGLLVVANNNEPLVPIYITNYIMPLGLGNWPSWNGIVPTDSSQWISMGIKNSFQFHNQSVI